MELQKILRSILLISSIFLIHVVSGSQRDVNVEEVYFAKKTANSFVDFSEIKYRKFNRSAYIMSGYMTLLKDVDSNSGLEVI